MPQPGLTLPALLTEPQAQRSARRSWDERMERAQAIDLLARQHCDVTRQRIALLTDGQVVRRTLAHMGPSTQPPEPAPTRVPSEPELAW